MDGDTMTTVYKFKAGFTKLGNATAPASAPVITIVDSANNVLINAQATTALSNMAGVYLYSYSGADDLDLVAKFVTSDLTMDAQTLFATPDIFSLMATASALSTAQSNITTILTDYARRTGDYSVLTAQLVWEYATRTITSGGITVAQIWDHLLTSITTSGSVGKLIKDYLDAAVSSRATPADVATSIAVSSTVAQAVSTGALAIEAGYTFRQTVTSTIAQDLSAASKLWLAIKNLNDDDANSIIFIEKTAGLTVVNKTVYATVANGSLTVTGTSGAWSIEIHIDEAATALLFGKNTGYSAGVKAKIGNDEISVWSGANNCSVTDGAVRTV